MQFVKTLWNMNLKVFLTLKCNFENPNQILQRIVSWLMLYVSQRGQLSKFGVQFIIIKWVFVHCKPIPCNENRVFPVKFSHREIPVMITGVPAMRTGVPCNQNRFFPVWKTSQGKPCSGPVLALYGIAVQCLPYVFVQP